MAKNLPSKRNALLERLMQNSTIKESVSVFKESKFFGGELIPTDVPIVNVAFSGSLYGGFTSGVTVIAGPSKNFKSNLGLIAVKAYLTKYEDAVCIFYDNEFGATPGYFASLGIDTSRVIHCPMEHIEQLKFDMRKQIEGINKGDRVIFFIDSIGMLPSKKEVEDALNEKSVADMTRARALKGLFRLVTSTLRIKELPAIFIAHTYECGTREMMVKTQKGDVSLADIKVGDIVLTTNGYEPVSYTCKHEGAFVDEIELEDGTVLAFTAGHKFKVN